MNSQTAEGIEEFQRNPVLHIEEIQGVSSMEDYQKEIALALVDHERVTVKSAHNVGKTWLASKIVLAFGSSFPFCKIITTAPTFKQVKQLLWSEINAGFKRSRSPLGGVMLDTQWKLDDDWFAFGFTSRPGTADSGKGQGTESGFQGFHAPYILVVFDEATGIPKTIWDQVEGILTSGYVRFLCLGNPTSKASLFYKTFTLFNYKKFTISCFQSPNLVVNGITNLTKLIEEMNWVRSLGDDEKLKRLSSYKVVSPYLLSTRWVIERALEWGIEHPLFVSKALAEFPDEDDFALYPLGLVENAMYREGIPGDNISIGVDVARFGPDKSVITILGGNVQESVKVLVKQDSEQVGGATIQAVNQLLEKKLRSVVIAIDGTGVGSGAVDVINAYRRNSRTWQRFVKVIEVNFGEGFDKDPEYLRAEKKKKYLNRKAEIYLMLSDALKSGELSLLEENVYLEEMPTIIYRLNAKGQYVIESKDDYKKRTGRDSPDHTDSLALANFARGKHNTLEVRESSDAEIISQPLAPSLATRDTW